MCSSPLHARLILSAVATLARLLGRSQAGVSRVLKRLVEQGVVDVQEARPALLFNLNRDHLFAPAILLIANARGELLKRLSESIQAWSVEPVHASVFGSAARGDGGTESDIDLFVVRPNHIDEDDTVWRSQIESLAENVYRWSGNRAGISEISQRELARLRREEPPIVDELRSDAIALAGPRLMELLKVRR